MGELCLCLGSCSGGVHSRIQGGHHGYGVHSWGQTHGGLAVNIDLLGVLVGLQEEE